MRHSQAGHYVVAAAILLAAVLLILFMPRGGCCCQNTAPIKTIPPITLLGQSDVFIPPTAPQPPRPGFDLMPPMALTPSPVALEARPIPATAALLTLPPAPALTPFEPTIPPPFSVPYAQVDEPGEQITWLGFGVLLTAWMARRRA